MRAEAGPASDAPVASAAAGASWRPLLAGSQRDKALTTVAAIGDLIRSSPVPPTDDPTLASGTAGIAVFFAALAQSGRGADADVRAARYLEHAIEFLATQPLPASLYTGFTGIAWAVDVVDVLLGTPDADRVAVIDEALQKLLSRSDWDEAPYDLINGLAGFGVYALARLPRPTAVRLARAIVDWLARLARRDDDGVFWWTPPSLLLAERREHYPRGGVDLGVAHGVAGVIPVLARIRALGYGGDVADELLHGAVEWLVAHAVRSETGPTIPYFVADGAAARPARTAWCYGDPGVAAALLLAANEVNDSGWRAAAIDLAIRAAQRPLAETGVVDAGFCHGAAGLAHLFNRMHQATGAPGLADAARFWVDQTLNMCSHGQSWPDYGLLEGPAGVALVLLAASTDTEPVWDAMYLVSTQGSRS